MKYKRPHLQSAFFALSLVTLFIISLVNPQSSAALVADNASPGQCTYEYGTKVVPDGAPNWNPGTGFTEAGQEALVITMTGDCLSVDDEEVFWWTFTGEDTSDLNSVFMQATGDAAGSNGPYQIRVNDFKSIRGEDLGNGLYVDTTFGGPDDTNILIRNVSFARQWIEDNGVELDDGLVVPPGSAEATPEELPPTCEEREGTTFGFVTCGLLRGVTGTLNFADRILSNMLSTPNDYIENQSVESAWTAFRNLAYILLVPALLIMVIGTALGFEFVSAYTVKKALPRMIAATIFIAFSFEIAKFLIISVNTIGNGVQGFLAGSAGFEEFSLEALFRPTGGTDILTGALGIGAAVAVTPWLINGGIFIILGFLMSAAIAVLIVLFLLAFRQVGIMILAILAPLAILAWIFPGNTKLWGLWRTTFLKLLLLYPVIMLAIGAGKLFAGILAGMNVEVQTELINDGTDNDTGYLSVLTNRLLILVAYVGPYFFIPTLFKTAGGAFGRLVGIANNKERGLMDRSRNWGRKQKEDRSNLNKASKEMRKRNKNIDILTGDKEGFGKNDNFKRTRRALTSVRTRGGLTTGSRIEEDTLREVQIERSNQEEKAAIFELQKQYSNNTAKGIDRSRNLEELERVATDTSDKTSHAKRKAANKLLTQQQAVENIARVRKAGLQSDVVANGFNDVLGENFATLSSISPDLANEVITGQDEATFNNTVRDSFGKVGPEQHAQMKPDAWVRYFDANPEGAKKAWQNLRANPDYATKIKQEVVDKVEGVRDYADPTKTPEEIIKKRNGLLGADVPRIPPAIPARDRTVSGTAPPPPPNPPGTNQQTPTTVQPRIIQPGDDNFTNTPPRPQ